jgi:hypothetical protein
MTTPTGLGAGGKRLWKSITEDHELDAAQLAQLEEACREKDRCDALARMIDSEDDAKTWLTLVAKANETANQMKQLLAALRLPDATTGKKPQRRGPRGAYQTGQPGKVSSLDRARQRATG